MKLLIIAMLISSACLQGLRADTYSDKYDGMNVDEAIANKRLFTAYLKCILEEGKCTPEGRELKNHISDALQTGCSKCTDAQRVGIKKVINHLIQNEPDYWQELIDKYDPKRVYTQKYENELRAVSG